VTTPEEQAHKSFPGCGRRFWFFDAKSDTPVIPRERYDIDIVVTMKAKPAKAFVKPVFYGGGYSRPISKQPPAKEVARIVFAPGTRISWILGVVMTRRAYRRYVYPAIAEMQAEYLEALAAGHRGHARWIAIRGHFLLIPGWLYGLVAQAVRRIFSPWAAH
jgi:hypothetical protein